MSKKGISGFSPRHVGQSSERHVRSLIENQIQNHDTDHDTFFSHDSFSLFHIDQLRRPNQKLILTYDRTMPANLNSDSFFYAVLRNGRGKSLNLKNATLDLASRTYLQDLLSSNQEVHKLIFCNVSSNDQYNYLPDYLLSNRMHMIEELKIEKCSIDAKAALAVANMTRSETLRSLKLVNMNLNNETIDIFTGITHEDCSLHRLELRGVRMDENNLSFLFECLMKNQTICSLYMDGCSLGSSCALKLADFLAENKRITTLSLCENDLDGESIKILVERGLQNNTTLQKLLLSQNPIGDSGAVCLSELLCSNPSIQFLSLSDCEIWAPGCLALARGLAHMRGLKQLIVDGEWEDHVDIVVKSMESNCTLVQLWTDRSPMLIYTNEQWQRVEFFLCLNRAKRRILFEPQVPASLWPRALANGGEDASIIYHMLRHKPELAYHCS